MLTTENTVRSFIKQMQSLNLDILDYCLLGKLRIFPVKAMKARDGMDRALVTLLNAVLQQQGQDIVIVDSVTSFIAHSTMEQVISFFEECKSYCNQGTTVAVVAHTYAFDESMVVRISSMCDAHLRLSLENLGERLMKILEVAKVRGAQQSTGNVVSFDVEPAYGMRIIPFNKAKA